jgi:dTDP-4-dehydrorhamnose reductase
MGAEHDLRLYARRPLAMQEWLTEAGLPGRALDLSAFSEGECDLIVNAIGDGAPGRIQAAGVGIVETTERFDQLCLDYLDRHAGCAYVFLSTGRVYGAEYEAAQEPEPRPLDLERFTPAESYQRAKRGAECRHRAQAAQRIADVRIFGYVSSEIALDDDFLVAQMFRALVDDVVFETTATDVVRDYVGAADLAGFLARLIDAGVPNNAYDLCSARPTTKFEMLDAMAREFGLRYVSDGVLSSGPRSRPETISRQACARDIGYVPRRTSLETVMASAAAIVAREKRQVRSATS